VGEVGEGADADAEGGVVGDGEEGVGVGAATEKKMGLLVARIASI